MLSPGFYCCLGAPGKLRLLDRAGLKDPVWSSLARQQPEPHARRGEARHSPQLSACLDTEIASPRPQPQLCGQGMGSRNGEQAMG